MCGGCGQRVASRAGARAHRGHLDGRRVLLRGDHAIAGKEADGEEGSGRVDHGIVDFLSVVVGQRGSIGLMVILGWRSTPGMNLFHVLRFSSFQISLGGETVAQRRAGAGGCGRAVKVRAQIHLLKHTNL